MSSLIKRIKKRVDMTVENLKSDLKFSPRLAALRVVDDFSIRLGFNKIANAAHNKKNDFINNYIFEIIKPVIEKYKAYSEPSKNEQSVAPPPIWICWWSGFDEAPEIVKQCIRSVKKNSGVHPVNLITEENYGDYIEIPSYILERQANGDMCLANMSDYIRAVLISKFGGLWLDSTMFLSDTLPEYCFEGDFFTLKSPETESRYLSRYRWVTFCLGGKKDGAVFLFLKEAFEEYWKAAPGAIDYLFFDNLIDLAYENIPLIRELIESVPVNNLRRDDLQKAMNDRLPAGMFYDIVKPDTVFYKLSWRETYERTALNGESSVYDYFLKMEF